MLTRITLFISILLMASHSYGQYRRSLQDYYYKKVINENRFPRRISLGVGKHFIDGKAILEYNGTNTVTNTVLSTTLEKSIKLKPNWTVYLGSYFPITIVSDNSMLVVNTELMAGMAHLGYDSVQFLDPINYVKTAEAYRVGMLLSVEYRLGGDVTLNKNEGVMFTVGGGFNPSIVSSTDYDIIVPYKLVPFIKAELGFFAGMAVKLRGIMYFGSSVYASDEAYDINQTVVTDHLKTYMSGSNGFDLALVIMPFSVRWNSDKW
jgi:hypothetical protein